MKVSVFHLMPHRELPDDFEKRYHSVWVDPPWWELADAERVGQYYRWTLAELLHAARMGADGICTNEHHQNAYGFMPNPNIMGGILAWATQGMDVAIVQMGATLPTRPPLQVAEEYAMLDCISGGRLIAGMPLGTPWDVNMAYGVPPVDQRPRFREALDLVIKAWTAREIFAWNGRFFQYGMVNLWPRPIQQPHPPIWLPGSGSPTTWDLAVDRDFCYCFLSFYGLYGARRVANGYWERVEAKGKDKNPYRFGFAQVVAVAESDARAEQDYARHVEYFFHKCLHIAPEWLIIPGHQDYTSTASAIKGATTGRNTWAHLKEMRYRDFVEEGFVIAGSPATVRDRLLEACRELRIGNLMVLLHIGSMPHDLTLKNIELFCREVLPYLRPLWEGEWENHWWPQRLLKRPAGAPGND